MKKTDFIFNGFYMKIILFLITSALFSEKIAFVTNPNGIKK